MNISCPQCDCRMEFEPYTIGDRELGGVRVCVNCEHEVEDDGTAYADFAYEMERDRIAEERYEDERN